MIDIKRLSSRDTLEALDDACRNWGFFQVTQHGIDPQISNDMHRHMKDFFAQPEEVKQQISRSRDNPWGFYDRELTKNIRDWKQVFDFGPDDTTGLSPRWPAQLPGFEQAMLAYYYQCEKLSQQLLEAISVNLGMPATHLSQSFQPGHSSFLRLNYYPVCPPQAMGSEPTGTGEIPLGVNQHTDAGVLTILAQDGHAGLEVQKGGEWHLVEARDDETATGNEDAPVIVAETKMIVPALSVSDAVMQMDLAEQPVLVFRNASHGDINVVYRRADGNIGWIDTSNISN